MKMIDVLNMMAKGEIKERTILLFDGYQYRYVNNHFEDDSGHWLEANHAIIPYFLNQEVLMIFPKEKKYLIKVRNWYLTYDLDENNVVLATKRVAMFRKSHFTKSETQSILAVNKFLEDIQGEYEVIEVKEDESVDS